MGLEISELRTIYEELITFVEKFRTPEFLVPINAIENQATEVGEAWSRSWLGYQSCVYFGGLKPPPRGVNFSSEWGLLGGSLYSREIQASGWLQFNEHEIKAEIRKRAGNPNLAEGQGLSAKGRELFERRHGDVVSILQTAHSSQADPFIEKLLKETGKIEPATAAQIVSTLAPSRQIMSRDSLAVSQGFWLPPHISVSAEAQAMKELAAACELLGKVVRRAFSHLERVEQKKFRIPCIGTNVFIGHGRSKEWKDLKDFIKDRMGLPWDEFNRVAIAGIPNAVRLSTMLDSAAIAFLVFTAEDETTDGKWQARMNVIHEAGLFQGRLGFNRAIVMLEEGCEEFSNIHGIGQIRFPKGNIRAAFHDVELVLERERLVESPAE